MKIDVTEQPSLWVLQKRYQWKYPGKSWSDPQQVLLAVKLSYHSRLDENHYRKCEPCYQDHLDFMHEQEMDAQFDVASEMVEG